MHRLAREIGLKPAMSVLLTGDSIDASRAQNLGLVSRLVAQEESAFPALQAMLLSEDIQEGLSAFLEKRRPEWKAR